MAEQAADTLKSLEKEVKELRKRLGTEEKKQTRASHEVKRNRKAYPTLKVAREVVRSVRRQVVPKEAQLRAAKQASYYWNNVVKAPKAKEAEKEMKEESKVYISKFSKLQKCIHTPPLFFFFLLI